MGAAASFVSLALLATGGSIAARRGLGIARGLPAFFGAVILGWTWLSAGTLLLGSTGRLSRWSLVGWSGLGLAAASATWLRRTNRIDGSGMERPASWPLEAALAFSLALWACLVLAVPSWIFPVKVVSDGPIYHLYFAARWWQSGWIEPIPTPFGESAAPYFPGVGELWLTWLFTTWGGDQLAKVGQAPFLAIAGLAVYSLARQAGSRPAAAAIAAAWFVTITPLVVFSFEPNVDTLFIAGILLSTDFVVRNIQERRGVASLLLAGLSAGLAWGVKAPGIVFLPPMLAICAGALLFRKGSVGGRIRDAAVVIGSAVLLQSVWWLRNARWTGNPLYPLDVTLFGRTIWPGWYGAGAMPTSPYYIDRGDWRAFLDQMLAVLDPRLAAFWLFAVAGAWRFARARKATDWIGWTCAWLAVLNVALFWLVVPYRSQQRFMLQAFGFAAVPLALLLDRGKVLRWLALGLLGIHVLTSQAWPFERPPLDFSPMIPSDFPSPVPLQSLGADGLAVGLACLLVGAASCASRRLGRRAALVLAVVAFGLAVRLQARHDALPERGVKDEDYRYPRFADYRRGWADLGLRIGKGAARIAYAGTNLPYYLMGEDFRHVVRYVNVDAHRTWLLHDYHRAAAGRGQPTPWPDTRPGWDRLTPDYDAWLANLQAEAIQILVTTRANPAEGRINVADAEGFTIERVWADSHPERFRLLYADPLFRSYALTTNPRR